MNFKIKFTILSKHQNGEMTLLKLSVKPTADPISVLDNTAQKIGRATLLKYEGVYEHCDMDTAMLESTALAKSVIKSYKLF